MEERFLGEVIKEKRIEQGISQWNLCEGICDVTTLSRLENGKQTPKRNIVKALLQRLGISDDRFFAAVTTEEIKLNELFKDITALNIKYGKSGKDIKLKEMLIKKQNELENLIEDNDNISRQMLVRSQVIISDDTEENKIKLLMKALQLTHPGFEESQIKKCLLTFDEVKILNQIAGSYAKIGNHQKAAEILDQLLKNIENRFNKIIPSMSNKALILCNLSRELLACNDVINAKKYAEEGKDLAIQYCIFINLPEYIMILAECEHRLGNTEACKELLIEAYYLCKVIGDESNRKIINESLKEYHNITL